MARPSNEPSLIPHILYLQTPIKFVIAIDLVSLSKASLFPCLMSQYQRIKDPLTPFQSTSSVREIEPLQYGDPVQRHERTATKALGEWNATRSTAFIGDLFLALIPIFFIGTASRTPYSRGRPHSHANRVRSCRSPCCLCQQQAYIFYGSSCGEDSAFIAHNISHCLCCHHGETV